MYVIVLGLLVLGACALAILAGRRRFRTLMTADVLTLFSNAAASVGPDQVQARWNGLPEPVRGYLSYAIPKDAPAIRTARLKHDGFFRTKPGERWLPIEGVQLDRSA